MPTLPASAEAPPQPQPRPLPPPPLPPPRLPAAWAPPAHAPPSHPVSRSGPATCPTAVSRSPSSTTRGRTRTSRTCARETRRRISRTMRASACGTPVLAPVPVPAGSLESSPEGEGALPHVRMRGCQLDRIACHVECSSADARGPGPKVASPPETWDPSTPTTSAFYPVLKPVI